MLKSQFEDKLLKTISFFDELPNQPILSVSQA